MATKLTQVDTNDDLQYGSAANGLQVGSGFDCEIKRESRTTALVNVTTPDGSGDWLLAVDVEPDTNLQRMAIEIGRCPEFGDGGYTAKGDEGWSDLADRWNAIELSGTNWIEDDSDVIDAIEGAKSDWFDAHANEALPPTNETTDGEINEVLGLPWCGALRPLSDEFASWSKEDIQSAVKQGLDNWRNSVNTSDD